MRSIIVVVFSAVLVMLASAVSAQTTRIIVGVPAGSAIDSVARMVADRMREDLGHPIIVENKPGAALRLATEYVASAPPDGSTLLLSPMAVMAIYPYAYASLRFDPMADFVAVSHIVGFSLACAVTPSAPASTLKDYIALAKRNPKYTNYGSSGAGTQPHFLGVMFARAADLDLVHVPYKGPAPAISDLVGGHLPMYCGGLSDLQPLHKAGKVRVLASSGAERSIFLPDVPTFKEQGFDIEGTGWYALYAPAKTPAALVERYAGAAVRAVKSAAIAEKLHRMGLEPTGFGPDETTKIHKRDIERWGPVVRASGYKADQ